MIPVFVTNGICSRVCAPTVIVWISLVFLPAIENVTAEPVVTVIALGKNALIVKRRPRGARPRSTLPAVGAGAAAAARAWRARLLSSAVAAARFCASVGTRRRELTTRTRPVMPGWIAQK